MNTLDILIIIDTLAVLATSNLMNNVYLVDTNKYLGSWQEGTDDLRTLCQDGQLLTWRVTSISPCNEVNISGFSGQMVSENICTPSQQGGTGDLYWEGRIETKGNFGLYQYTVEVSIDGRYISFSPCVKVA